MARGLLLKTKCDHSSPPSLPPPPPFTDLSPEDFIRKKHFAAKKKNKMIENLSFQVRLHMFKSLLAHLAV